MQAVMTDVIKCLEGDRFAIDNMGFTLAKFRELIQKPKVSKEKTVSD